MKLFAYLLSILCYPLWFFIPVVHNRWSFAAWGGSRFSDNPKALYEYIRKNEVDIDCAFIVKSFSTDLDCDIYEAYSPKAIWHLMTSESLIFTHSAPYDFLKFFVNPKSLRCLTWHGRTVKKIGNLLPVSRFQKWKRLLIPMLRERVDLTICLHDSEKKFLKDAFLVPESNIFTTGYPRNDETIRMMETVSLSTCKASLKILYVPTYRGTKVSDVRLEQYICEFIDLADSDFRTNSVEIECRLHPAHIPGTRLEEKVNNSYSFNFPTTNAPFQNEYLVNYDLLITDYSSILFDYMLLKKPYLLFQPDFEYYMSKNKGFVDDSLVRDLFVHDNSFKCIDSESLIAKIKGVNQNSVINNEAILKRAHLYCDDMSSERVFIAICRRLKELGRRRYSGET